MKDTIEKPKIRRKGMHPTQLLTIGFASIILFGAVILTLPISTISRQSVGFLNALFTSTTAVCVTGLVVVDTGTTFSLFGQVIIMLLIQAGGLGFMTLATVMLMVLRRRITLKDRLNIQEATGEQGLRGLVRLVRNIVLVTFVVEAAGTLLFSTRFIPEFGLAKGIYFSIFHAVSAFCNAGIDLIGNFQSFVPYRHDIIINFTTMALIVIGGIGFTVILDIYSNHRFSRLSTHSKLVLIVTGILIVSGAALFLCMEWSNARTLGAADMGVPNKIMASLFQSVTTRTAGFNTIDQNGMTASSKLLSVILMFIGASPGGTGGGIKTSTFSILLLMLAMVLQGRDSIIVLKRQLDWVIAYRALAIAIISMFVVTAVTMAVSMVEIRTVNDHMNFLNVLFEVTSGFGTVGLSTGITPELHPLSKVLLIITMFIGRVGPLTLLLALAKQIKKDKVNIKYPDSNIMVG